MLRVKTAIVNKVAMIIKATYVNISAERLISNLFNKYSQYQHIKKGTTEVVPFLFSKLSA